MNPGDRTIVISRHEFVQLGQMLIITAAPVPDSILSPARQRVAFDTTEKLFYRVMATEPYPENLNYEI